MSGANLATPLYAVYASKFGFSNLVLTTILRHVAATLVALVLAAPLSSLALIVGGAVAARTGHGLAFLNAQEELNHIAPQERRGEVTAVFIACIYFLVASAVIGTGLLDLRFSLSVSVSAVALVLVASALSATCWQLKEA